MHAPNCTKVDVEPGEPSCTCYYFDDPARLAGFVRELSDCEPEKSGRPACGDCRSCLRAMIELRNDQMKLSDEVRATERRELRTAQIEVDRLRRELEAAGMRWPQTVSTLEDALKSFPAGRIWLDQWTRAEVERDRRITPEAHALELTKQVNEAVAEALEEDRERLHEDVMEVLEKERGFAPDPVIDSLKEKIRGVFVDE